MAAANLSAVERIKAASRGLRGTIVESLADPVTGGLADDDQQLLKFHGSYQQYDRDSAEARRQAKLEPAYSFMIRTRLPGGLVSPAQWLALDALATRHANGTLRLTSRQAFQLHGVLKGDLLIVGSGDPTIAGRAGPAAAGGRTARDDLDGWIDALETAGIRRIEGRVIGDDDAIEEPRPQLAWAWDDLGYTTGALFGALNLMENRLTVTVTPGSASSRGFRTAAGPSAPAARTRTGRSDPDGEDPTARPRYR